MIRCDTYTPHVGNLLYIRGIESRFGILKSSRMSYNVDLKQPSLSRSEAESGLSTILHLT